MVKNSVSKYLGFLLLGNLFFLLLGAFPSLAFLPSYTNQHIIATRQTFFVSTSRPTTTTTTSVCFVATTTTTTTTRRTRSRKWDEMIPRLQEFKEEFGHTNITSAYDPDLYGWVRKLRNNYSHQIRNSTRKPRLSEEKIQILKELDFDWGTDRNTRWNRLILELKKYKDTHGDTYVKFEDNRELCTWTKHLRYNYRHQVLNASTTSHSRRRDLNVSTTNHSHRRRPQLPPSKMKELNDLGFDWEPKQRVYWKRLIQELQRYKDKHGHTYVTFEENEDLYKWTKHLRDTYRYQALNMSTVSHPRRPHLSSLKMDELNKLGFDWESQRGTRWKGLIENLKTYKDQNGHTDVKYEEDGELYKWTKHLRDFYRHQALNISTTTSRLRQLSPTKLRELNDIGFDWEVKRGTRWKRLVQNLESYKKKHGHTHVKFEENAELHKWTKSLRYMYSHQALNMTLSQSRRPHLSTWKMKELDDLGFDWDAKIKYSKWDDMMQRLVAYKEKHGHTIVQKSDDAKLHRWTTHLVNAYGPQLSNSTTTNWHRRLSKKRLQELRDIDFTWKSRSSLWKRRYEELQSFRREHGHCNPPARENPQLYIFVQNQRQAFRRYCAGKSTFLTEERVQALERIEFDWARPHDAAWAERKDELDQYHEKYGHANVPQKFADNYKLGQWCMNQRTDYKKENAGIHTGLTESRIQLLEKVDFQWSPKPARWLVMAARLREYQAEQGNLDIKVSDPANQDLRVWLNEQRHFYRREEKRSKRLSPERIEILESIPDFSWRKKQKGPSKVDWSDLFVAIREKGIEPGGKAKQHIFDGKPRFQDNVKTEWTEQELLALWNEENDEDDENSDGDYDEDEGEFFEDEESRLFLRA